MDRSRSTTNRFRASASILGCTAVGFLAGRLVVAAPLTGAIIGALVGGAGTAASAAFAGIDDNFVREVEALMKPGTPLCSSWIRKETWR